MEPALPDKSGAPRRAGTPRSRGSLPSEPKSPKPEAQSPIAAALQGCAACVPKKAAVAWAQFVATISQLEAADVRTDSARMIRLVIEAGYEDYLQDNFANYRSRLEDLEQLAVFARGGVPDAACFADEPRS